MENQNGKARIFVGREKKNFYVGEESHMSAFAIHYGGKVVDNTRVAGGCHNETCVDMAKEYAQILFVKNILDNYELVNGQGFDLGNLNKANYDKMPLDALKLFKRNLKKELSSKVA